MVASVLASTSASVDRSNPSADVVQVYLSPLLPTVVSFDSMCGGVRGFPWIDGAMLVEFRGNGAMLPPRPIHDHLLDVP
jgi:hypothetical protein